MKRSETSDAQLLELLRKRGSASISEMATASSVTATAVRQRITRLMADSLVERDVHRTGRGRPSHRYTLSEKARRQAANNFGDLALVLWEEIRAVKDPNVRRGLLQRLAHNLARLYADRVEGGTAEERMESLKEVFAERSIPLEVHSSPSGPMLTVVDCPYTELVEKDRSVCAMEKMLFAELVGSPLKLAECRLDGHACCQFSTT